MLKQLKIFFKSVFIPTLFLIAVGGIIDTAIQTNAYFWFDLPIIKHPFPYSIYYYFALGLSTIAIYVYSKESN